MVLRRFFSLFGAKIVIQISLLIEVGFGLEGGFCLSFFLFPYLILLLNFSRTLEFAVASGHSVSLQPQLEVSHVRPEKGHRSPRVNNGRVDSALNSGVQNPLGQFAQSFLVFVGLAVVCNVYKFDVFYLQNLQVVSYSVANQDFALDELQDVLPHALKRGGLPVILFFNAVDATPVLMDLPGRLDQGIENNISPEIDERGSNEEVDFVQSSALHLTVDGYELGLVLRTLLGGKVLPRAVQQTLESQLVVQVAALH